MQSKKNKLLPAYKRRFGKPDALIPLETGSAKIDMAITYPIEEEDLFDSSITTLGLSEAGTHMIEFYLEVLGKPSQTAFTEIGKTLIQMWESNATQNKPFLPGRIFRNVSFPSFEGMDTAMLIDHGGGFDDDQWIDEDAEGDEKGRLLNVIPLYSEEADALEKAGQRLRHLILNESNIKYRDPERKQADVPHLALQNIWKGIAAWYKKHKIAEAGKLAGQLKADTKKNMAEDIEKQLGVSLPEDFRQSFAMMHITLPIGMFELIDKDQIIEMATERNEMNEQGLFAKGLKKLDKDERRQMAWCHKHWIPFAWNSSDGDILSIDLCPGPEGTFGQIIHHSNDEGPLVTEYASFLEWLTEYWSCIENDECEISKKGGLYFPDHSCY
jgi:cell wall assembly regulator SMI1